LVWPRNLKSAGVIAGTVAGGSSWSSGGIRPRTGAVGADRGQDRAGLRGGGECGDGGGNGGGEVDNGLLDRAKVRLHGHLHTHGLALTPPCADAGHDHQIITQARLPLDPPESDKPFLNPPGPDAHH
jgi:hypothetical protein